MEDKKTIGLWGIVFTITGFVVGVSIFILPADLIGIAGPSVLTAYALAGAMAIVTCFATAQIGTLLPAEGGTFVAISKLISPYFGFLAVWVLLCAVILVNAFVAYGFADYIVYFLPGLNKTVTAATVVLFFGIINVFGSDLVVKFQTAMVVVFLIMLSIFIIAGLPEVKFANLTPFVPNGSASVFEAAAIGYFSFAGFITLLEFGGEIKNPAKNVPIGLTIAFVIVLGCYGGVSLILAGVDTGVPFVEMETPVLDVARTFLPGWIISALVISIIAAAATTVNGLILGYSRDIFVIAQKQLFPKILAKRSTRFKTPHTAIITYTVLSMIAISTGSDIDDYALVAVLGLLLQQLFIAVSLIRVPTVMKSEFAAAEFKLNITFLRIIAVLLFVISSAFIAKMVSDAPKFALIVVCVLLVGTVIYLIAKKAQRADNGN